MRPSVRKAFRPFTAEFEGVVDHLYCDNRGLVTTAIGKLVDASPAAAPWRPVLSLPLKRKDGTKPSDAEKIQDWERVKARQDWKRRGGRIYAAVAELRLASEDIDLITFRTLDSNDAILRKRLQDFEDLCGDAQLFCHSISWACGAWFEFPRLVEALRAFDFESALRECHIDENGEDRLPGTADDNRGLKPRNVANKILLRNAALVGSHKLDPERVYYPTSLETALPQNTVETAPELGNPPSEPDPAPVLEDDGGASRREATSWAVHEIAERRDSDDDHDED